MRLEIGPPDLVPALESSTEPCGEPVRAQSSRVSTTPFLPMWMSLHPDFRGPPPWLLLLGAVPGVGREKRVVTLDP